LHTGHALAGIVPLLPRPIVWSVAKKYVAGPTVEDALRATVDLERRGKLVSLDVLGEQFITHEQVMSMMAEYERALSELEHDHPRATLSVMMTGFGLRLDPHLCW
jgi:proline dehydrogenase